MMTFDEFFERINALAEEIQPSVIKRELETIKDREIVMTRGELCDMLVKQLKEYRASNVLESIDRNRHMNEYSGEYVKQEVIDAILVDFVNYLAMQQGIDLALYAKDIHGEIKPAKEKEVESISPIERRLSAVNDSGLVPCPDCSHGIKPHCYQTKKCNFENGWKQFKKKPI